MIEAGTKLGRYEIVSLIGAGGMGEVFLAEDSELERLVALKVLPKDLASDSERLRRFAQEAKSASALNHPNIITIHEIGKTDGTHFIATEYIEGETLHTRLRSEPISLKSALDIAVQVASALDAAHRAGIVHRDIKPENVMIRPDGVVKILDFGIAKLTEKKANTIDAEAATAIKAGTSPGMIIGTAAYMSPEQARGKDIDARSDIFSFGVVFYEMLTGKQPFEGESAIDTISSIIHKDPVPLSQLASGIPRELQRIVEKSLRKDREERYQTAKDLLIDLKDVRQDLEIQNKLERTASPQREETKTQILSATTSDAAHTTSSTEYVTSKIKSHKRGFAIGLMVLLLASIGLGYWYLTGRSTKQIESIAVMPFVNESGNADNEYLSDGMTETLIKSLSQLPNLNVKPRSSVFRYKGKETNLQTIGKELNVQAILNGRVVQRDDGLTLSLELVDVSQDKVIWAEQYERKISDLVSLQSEVARDVLSKLKIRLTGADEQKLAKKSTESAEAYQLYIQGRYEWNKFSFDSLKKSIPLFERAIQKDPTYALAYSGLADSYVNLGVDYISAQDAMPQARVAAIQAIALDDSLAEAYTSLGSYKMFYEWDIKGAEEEYRKAISLDAKYGNARHFYSHCLQFLGREAEAIREMKIAVKLEPVSLVNNSELGWAYYLANQHDAAIEQLHKTIRLDPSYSYSYFILGLVYADKGNYAEAVAALREGQKLSPDWLELQAVLAYTYASAGERGEAEALLTKLLKSAADTYVNPVLIASVYVALADNDRAIAWLERGYREKCSWMSWIAIEPQLERLRPDPRFQDLVSRVNR
ncbi:MAG: protein kinase [Pyrinomonadaceae bacterium]